MRYIYVLFLGLAAFPGNRADAFGPGYTRINAVAESAETAYTNPAGMTRFDEKTTSAGASFIKSFKEFNVDDEDRSFWFALDRMFGIGVGMHKKLASGNHNDLNFNLIDTGEGPIDTGSDPVRGRVAGESDNHYAITVDFSFHWR